MKYKFILALFLMGFAVSIVGSLFKLMHWPYAGLMLTVSMSLQAIAVLILIVKLLRNKDVRNFLNK